MLGRQFTGQFHRDPLFPQPAKRRRRPSRSNAGKQLPLHPAIQFTVGRQRSVAIRADLAAKNGDAGLIGADHESSRAAAAARSARRRAGRFPYRRAHSEVITPVTSRTRSSSISPPYHREHPRAPRGIHVLKAETAKPLPMLHYYHSGNGTRHDAAQLPPVSVQPGANLLDHLIGTVPMPGGPINHPARLPVQVLPLVPGGDQREDTTQRASLRGGATT